MVPCSLRPESLKKKYNTNEPSGVSQRRRVLVFSLERIGVATGPRAGCYVAEDYSPSASA